MKRIKRWSTEQNEFPLFCAVSYVRKVVRDFRRRLKYRTNHSESLRACEICEKDKIKSKERRSITFARSMLFRVRKSCRYKYLTHPSPPERPDRTRLNNRNLKFAFANTTHNSSRYRNPITPAIPQPRKV